MIVHIGIFTAVMMSIRIAIRYYRRSKKLSSPITPYLPALHAAYAGINGFELSVKDRESMGIGGYEWVYGEMPVDTFADIITLIQSHRSESELTTMIDLGSGIGQVVLATALLLPVKQAIGYELLPSLVAASELAFQRLLEDTSLPEKFKSTEIEFILGDYKQADLEHADLVFFNATGSFGGDWDEMQEKLCSMKPGAWIVLTSRTLPETAATLIDQRFRQLSWGWNRVMIYQRIDEPRLERLV